MCSYTRGVRATPNIGARHCPIKGRRCQGRHGWTAMVRRSATAVTIVTTMRDAAAGKKISSTLAVTSAVTTVTRLSRGWQAHDVARGKKRPFSGLARALQSAQDNQGPLD